MRARFPSVREPKQQDICYATQNRQDAVKLLSPQVDLVIVVGSPTSSNSNRLRELAQRLGTVSYMVDSAAELKPEWFEGKSRVGLTAGASAPEVLVREVIDRVKALGAVSVRKMDGIEETLKFPAAQGPEARRHSRTGPYLVSGAASIDWRRDIEAAARRLHERAPHFLRETPLWKLPGRALGVEAPGVEVWLKLEHLQASGSFKARGMMNRLLANEIPAAGAIVASGGNAGIATAAAAHALGVHCEVFLPTVSPEAKRARLRALGATRRGGRRGRMPMRWRPASNGSARAVRCSPTPTTSPKWWPAPARSAAKSKRRAACRTRCSSAWEAAA